MRKDQRGVFISYRRDGGSDVARVIQAFLESKGFDPFLDVDGLGSGHFDSQLLQRIEECPHFILICSPGALDRVVNDGDWVRREIEHALKTSRNIVPVVVPGFDWSKIGSLPGEISEISSHNHFDYHHAHWTQIRHKLLALLEPRSPEPPVEQPKRAGPWQSLIDLDPLDPIHSADPLKLLVVSDLMRELESETGLARESVCWELLEYSVPLWRTNSNSASLCFARLSCALEVDCPGVGAPAPPTAARLVGALSRDHPLRSAFVTAERRKWRDVPAPGRNWAAWERSHSGSELESDWEVDFRHTARAIAAGGEKQGVAQLERLAGLGHEPAMLLFADLLLDGRKVARDTQRGTELIEAVADLGNSAAAIRLAVLRARAGDVDGLAMLERLADEGVPHAQAYLDRNSDLFERSAAMQAVVLRARAGDLEPAYQVAKETFEEAMRGPITPETLQIGLHWCRRAAKSGHPLAQFLLSEWLSRSELGGSADSKEALLWMYRAASNGHADAEERMKTDCRRRIDVAIELREAKPEESLRLLSPLVELMESVWKEIPPANWPPEYWSALYSRALTALKLGLLDRATADLAIAAPWHRLANERLDALLNEPPTPGGQILKQRILIYGHGDKSEDGFPTAESFRDYIARGVFSDCHGRYRFSQAKHADIVVLARDGLAYGHFEIDSMEEPTDSDREAYPRVRKVYIVRKSVAYGSPVRLVDMGVSGYQFGRYLSGSEWDAILTRAG